MIITAGIKDLKNALTWTVRAIPAKPSHPVLGNVLLSATQDLLHLTGFDLSMGINAQFGIKTNAETKEEMKVTLPSGLLLNLLNKFPDGEITIEVDRETAIASITSASGKYQIRGLAAEEYPALPEIKGGFIEIPTQAILDGAKALEFASTEETKQNLCGIHLKIKEDCFEFATTNGHCLMTVSIPVEVEETEGEEGTEEPKQETTEFAITIPARAFREVEKMVTMHKSLLNNSVTLHYEKEQVVFELAGQRVICRALDGAYPAYPQLIPSKFTNLVTVDRRNFLGALERVAVVATQKNDVAICAIDSVNQQISLLADVADVGSASESLPAQISAEEPKEIGFNVKYLITAIKEFNSSEITLQLNSESSPVVVVAVPVGGLKMLFLLMPVQLRK